MMRIRGLGLGILLFLWHPVPSSAQPASPPSPADVPAIGQLQGHWVGRLDRGGTTAEFRLHLEPQDGQLRGQFDWPDLGYRRTDLLGVRLAPGQVRMAVPLPVGSLRMVGTLDGNTIRGTLEETVLRAGQWTTLPVEGRFELRRTRPQQPPYEIRQVRFTSGGTTLAGEIYRPRGQRSVPGVVFVHGSGNSSRSDGAFYADRLARSGIAVLVYDKRGVGESGGDWRHGGYEELAQDAHAALTFLSAQSGINRGRIGYIGRSEGAWVTPLAVRMGGATFAAFISGPTVTVADEDIDHYRVALRQGGFGEAEMASAFALLRLRHAVIAGQADQARLDAEVARHRSAPWFATLNWDEAVSKTRTPFEGRTIAYDPRDALRNLGIPSYWLFGTDDNVIPVGDSVARLLALELSPRPTILVLPKADHALAVTSYPRLPGQVSRAASLLAEWINDGGPLASGRR